MSEYISSFFEGVTISAPSAFAVGALVIAAFLLVFSGFFSASEIAFFSLTPADIDEIEESETVADGKINYLRAHSEHLLATILIANNFVNVAIIVLCNLFFAEIFDFGQNKIVEFLLITVILTFLLLLFGEIMPKIYSANHTLSFCRFVAPTIYFLQRMLHPFASVLVRSTSIAEKVVKNTDYSLSTTELSQALELTDKREISDDEKMLKGIIRFGDETVKDVMTPRLDIVALDMRSTYDEVLKLIVDNNYSRIPVFQGSIDNIKGVLYIKDLLPHLQKPVNFRWQTLVRQPYFVPETKKIDDLLGEFQQNKIHIAVVVDEFGGTSGIATMEDILEEIVGEINDEYDDDEDRLFVRLNQNTYVFDAKISLDDFIATLGLDSDMFCDDAGDADTLAGLLLELKGDFPKLHEKIDYKNIQFETVAADKRRILKVKVVVKNA